jgi:hypothetical protein
MLVTRAYHWVFLGICIISFTFAIIAGGWGIAFVFQHPDKYTAGVAIEVVSALGFFTARWSQKTFMMIYREAALDETTRFFIQSPHAKDNPEIFKEIMKETMKKRIPLGDGLKDKHINDY